MSVIRIAGRTFRPGWMPTLAAAAFIALTIALGNWQTRRADEKIQIGRKIDEAARAPVLTVPSTRVEAAGLERRRVAARGSFVARDTLFLDNKLHRGAAGYQVLTPLRLEGGVVHVLVDRGWIAAGDRSKLPAVATPEGLQTVE